MKYLIFILLFAVCFSGFSQTNYQKGFIVSNSGDTTRGFINYKEWGKNPEHISFKTSDDADRHNFSVADLAAFGLEGMAAYERWTVSISLDDNRLEHLNESVDTSRVTKPVFLKVIEKGGDVSLFSYRDDLKERFYLYSSSFACPKELEIHFYLSDGKFKTKKDYIFHLLSAAEARGLNDQKFIDRVYRINYSQGDLVKVLNILNRQETARRHSDSGVKFFAGLKLVKNLLFYTGDHFLANKDASFANQYTPALAAGLNWYTNKRIQKTFVRVELAAFKLASETSYTSKNNSTTIRDVNKVEQLGLSLSPQFGWNLYNKRNLQWFVGAGLGLNYYSFSKNSYSRTYMLPDLTEENSRTPPDLNNHFVFSLPFNTGLRLKQKIEISLGYNRSLPITSYMTYEIYNKTMSAGIHYYFGK